MKMLSLLRGGITYVDDDVFESTKRFKWRVTKSRHVFTTFTKDGKSQSLHLSRMIMNAPPELEVDHIDRNPLNNQRHNLRLATRRQNVANTAKRKLGTSRFKGVYWHAKDKRWMARVGGAYIGQFKTESEAAKAYNTAALEHWGIFACLNSI